MDRCHLYTLSRIPRLLGSVKHNFRARCRPPVIYYMTAAQRLEGCELKGLRKLRPHSDLRSEEENEINQSTKPETDEPDCCHGPLC